MIRLLEKKSERIVIKMKFHAAGAALKKEKKKKKMIQYSKTKSSISGKYSPKMNGVKL